MRTWIFLTLVLTLSNSKAQSETPARFVVDDAGGRVEFATATVGGVEVFTEEELSAVSKLHHFKKIDTTIVVYSPTAFEKYLAESGIKFEGMSDFRKCVKDKDYLDDKLADMKPSNIRRNKTKIEQIKAKNSQR